MDCCCHSLFFKWVNWHFQTWFHQRWIVTVIVTVIELRFSLQKTKIFKSHRIHVWYIYANMNGVYWWDPCYHIYHTWIRHGNGQMSLFVDDPTTKNLHQSLGDKSLSVTGGDRWTEHEWNRCHLQDGTESNPTEIVMNRFFLIFFGGVAVLFPFMQWNGDWPDWPQTFMWLRMIYQEHVCFTDVGMILKYPTI